MKERAAREDAVCNERRTDRPEVIEKLYKQRHIKERMMNSYKNVQRSCRMTDAEIRMAERLRIGPDRLAKNLASGKAEHWKDSPGLWIRRMYERRFQKNEIRILRERNQQVYQKRRIEPLMRKAAKLHFTVTECLMLLELRITETELEEVQKQAAKTHRAEPALLIRRAYEHSKRTEAGA